MIFSKHIADAAHQKPVHLPIWQKPVDTRMLKSVPIPGTPGLILTESFMTHCLRNPEVLVKIIMRITQITVSILPIQKSYKLQDSSTISRNKISKKQEVPLMYENASEELLFVLSNIILGILSKNLKRNNQRNRIGERSCKTE